MHCSTHQKCDFNRAHTPNRTSERSGISRGGPLASLYSCKHAVQALTSMDEAGGGSRDGSSTASTSGRSGTIQLRRLHSYSALYNANSGQLRKGMPTSMHCCPNGATPGVTTTELARSSKRHGRSGRVVTTIQAESQDTENLHAVEAFRVSGRDELAPSFVPKAHLAMLPYGSQCSSLGGTSKSSIHSSSSSIPHNETYVGTPDHEALTVTLLEDAGIGGVADLFAEDKLQIPHTGNGRGDQISNASPMQPWQLNEQEGHEEQHLQSASDKTARHISGLILRTNRLGRFERILEQHATFLNSKHIIIALSILPGIADRSRADAADAVDAESVYRQGQQEGRSSDLRGGKGNSSLNLEEHRFSQQDDMAARARRVRVLSLASRLSQGFHRLLPEYGPKDLATAVWALARVRFQPGPRWISSVLASSQQQIIRFKPHDMSSLLWGLAVLKADPGAAWMDAAQCQTLVAACSSDMTLQSLTLSLWSIATITSANALLPVSGQARQHSREARKSGANLQSEVGSCNGSEKLSDSSSSNAVDIHWLQSYLSEMEPRLPELKAQDLTMVFIAFARFNHVPHESFMQAALSRCLTIKDDLRPGALSSVLWSLATLKYQPQGSWLQQFMFKTQQQFQDMTSKEKAMTLWAVVKMQGDPHESWVHAFEVASFHQLESFSPQDLTMTVWAMAKLGFRPGKAWMERVAQVSQDQLPNYSPQSLANLLWAIAEMRCIPHPTWLRSFAKISVQRMPESSPQVLSNTVLALAKLDRPLGTPWTVAFLQIVAKTLKRQKAAAGVVTEGGRRDTSSRTATALSVAAAGFSPQELTLMLWSLSKLRSLPGDSWMACAEAVALHLMPLMNAQNVSNLLLALSKASPYFSGRELLLHEAVARLSWLIKQGAICPQDLSNSLWALAMLSWTPEDDSLLRLLDTIEQLLPKCTPEEQAQILWAICKLRLEPPPGLLPQLVQLSWPVLGDMSYPSLWTFLSCMQRLEYRPPQGWIEQAAAATAVAAASPRSMSLPPRVRRKMADGVLLALDQLGHEAALLADDEEEHMWMSVLRGPYS